MKLVGSGAGDQIDDAAGRESELGRHGTALHFELFDSVHGGRDVDFAIVAHDVGAAVEQAAVHGVGAAIDADGADRRAAVRESGIRGAGVGFDAGRQQSQGERVAAIQREFLDAATLDDFTDRGAGGVEE